MEIDRIINDSYREASRALVMGTSPQALARARERAFVKTLAARFAATFAEDAALRVFSEYGRGNLTDFGTETMFSDIAVCRIGEGISGGRESEVYQFVAGLLWQVEIDFSRDWRCAIQAINRLNGGAAENKLLVGALLPQGDVFRRSIIAAFAAGAGDSYLALIPHPAEWETSEDQPEVWRLADGEWTTLS